ncbi:MAG: CopG family transcriptional regulator [Desulfobacteraceae bacterium]|nr:CopG family transcriptional regulator [Desulfobacteraceae bacterium]
MGSIKTAISMDRGLFQQVEGLAKEMDVSRSHFFVLAARDFLKRHESKKLLEAINDAYDDMPSSEEKEISVEMRNRHYGMVKGQW